MTLPATLACLCAVLALQTSRPWLLGLAGIFVGLTALAKPVGAALVVLPLLAPLLLPLPWQRRLLGGVLGLGGTLLAPLLLLLYLNAHSALPAAREALIGYNRLYAAESVQIILDGHLAWMWRIWEPMLVLALPGLVGLLATLVDRNLRTPAHIITVVWGATLLATALVSLRAFPH
jgi:4-amino-4-deoxy-L-arabinose transferase-like glycosyltransferase